MESILEGEQKYFLTKRQRESLKQRILYRHHNLGERVLTDTELMKIYSEDTGIAPEIIREEARRMHSRQNLRIKPLIITAMTLAGLVYGYVSLVTSNDKRFSENMRAYESAILKYEQEHHYQGVAVSSDMIDQFYRELFKGKGLIWDGNYGGRLTNREMPFPTAHYPGKDTLSDEQLIQMLEDYNPGK